MRDFWIIELWSLMNCSMEWLEKLSDEELEKLHRERCGGEKRV